MGFFVHYQRYLFTKINDLFGETFYVGISKTKRQK